jgi:DNA primase
MNNIIKSGFSPEVKVPFLSKILPRTGVYVLAEFRNGLKYAPVHHFFNNVEELEAAAIKYDATGVNTFNACASYKTNENRKQDNVGRVRSIWLDIDVGKANDSKSYATRKEALAELLKMCKALGLPAPMMVKSGMGLHVYWVLDRDLTKDEWQTIANAFSNALNSVNFKHDPSRTKDASKCASSSWNPLA